MIFYNINLIEAIDQKREALLGSNLTKSLWVILFTILVSGCKVDTEKSDKQLFKILSSDLTGIDFNNQLKDTPELNILSYLYYYNGAGIAVADFNNDGFDDLFFASNNSSNELYINRKDLKFEKVSKEASINKEGWSTGVTVVDINNDGLLDIYVCQLGNYKSFNYNNLLYVNKGINKKGIPSFKEEAKKYGLDFSGLSTQAAFFDYDLDGDLDMYLLNHSVHPVRNYGRGNNRLIPDKISGDKLFRNDNGFFNDVTSSSGIYSSKIGYGLGIGISDLNNDNYPDIYIGNDFFENDYLYINQKDGTFKEIISENKHKLGHTSHFSMGNDLADFNNDGNIDILSMDMLPEDLITYKSSGNEYAYNIYKEYLKNGYAPQYMQNTLHLNKGNNTFSEIAFLSGVSASEWSWSGLFMDFDNDGLKDIFISNGIYGATNDMDYINFISNENIQKRLSKGMSEEDMEMVNEIPQKKVANYFFKNNGDLTFSKLKNDQKSFSNGAIYSDLDNDGDLDIVTNNLNQASFVYKNLSVENKSDNNYLKIKFNGNVPNKLGIGAKIIVHTNNQKQVFENYLTRGYMSSVSPKINVGLGQNTMVDSLTVIWPGGKTEKIKTLAANQLITLDESNAIVKNDQKIALKENLNLTDSLNLDFVHIEHDSYEFNRDPLAPYMSSYLGPKISVADINNDGLDDIFIGNGKREEAKLILQTEKGFIGDDQVEIENISLTENNDNQFFDADGDGDLDLIIGNGGNEYKKDPPLKPSLFINEKGYFKDKSECLPDIYSNISVVSVSDFDNDGDLDLFLGTSSVTGNFGKTGRSYLLENDGSGNFKEITVEKSNGLQNIGLIRDAKWIDLNNDDYLDLVIVGHWMPLTIFINNNGFLQKEQNNGLEETNGLYNSIEYADFDKDGDLDFILGNWGLNSRLKASVEEPITLYRNDFDENGKIDPIMTYYYKGKVTVFATKDELMKQIPSLNKKFLSYNEFAKANFQDLFKKEKIENAEIKRVYTLHSCIVLNDGNGKFRIKYLPDLAQISSINTILIDDFNTDGYPDALVAGNNYQINTQLGQLDASHGLILMNDKKGNLIPDMERSKKYPFLGDIKDMKEIKIKDKLFVLIARNNDSLQIIDKSHFSYE
jgi:hypothetical protein